MIPPRRRPQGMPKTWVPAGVAELAAELADQSTLNPRCPRRTSCQLAAGGRAGAGALAVHNALHGLLRATRQPAGGGGATTNAAELERARLRAELERFVAMLRNADLTALGVYQRLRAHPCPVAATFAQIILADSINKLDFAHVADL